VSLPSSGETPSRPGARSSSGAQRGCDPAAAVSVLYCVTRHTPGTPSTLYTTTLPAAASLAFLCGLVLPFGSARLRRAAGVRGVPIASIAGPIGPGSANRPSCPFARVSSRCSYNTTSLHTHSVRSSPSRAAAAREGRAPGPWMGLQGYWGEPTRGGHGPRPTSRALWCLRPPPHEPHLGGRRSWTAWGAGAQHVPCRTAQDDRDRMVVRVAGAAQPALGRRQTRRHARR